MPLGDGGASFSLTLCLPHQQRLAMNGSLLPNGVTLDGITKPELNVSSRPGSRPPQGSLAGSGAGGPFPLQRSSVGIRWVSPQQSIPWESCWGRKGSKATGQPLTSPSLISSVPSLTACLPACFEKVNPVCLK